MRCGIRHHDTMYIGLHYCLIFRSVFFQKRLTLSSFHIQFRGNISCRYYQSDRCQQCRNRQFNAPDSLAQSITNICLLESLTLKLHLIYQYTVFLPLGSLFQVFSRCLQFIAAFIKTLHVFIGWSFFLLVFINKSFLLEHSVLVKVCLHSSINFFV